jgi:glycolate oxidase iron-sulfur subunit
MKLPNGDDPMEPGAWISPEEPSQDLIHDCVHCGFCLSTCPSYAVLGTEMDSPRGRIVLMDVGHDPGAEITPQIVDHFDTCLGCLACVTACPSGVQYDRLIEQTRPQILQSEHRGRLDRLQRWAIFSMFTHPARLRMLVPMLVLQRITGVGAWLSRHAPTKRLRAMLRLAPPVQMRSAVATLDRVTPASSAVRSRGRVALMQGCVQRVFFADVNAATARVLAAEGWQVHAPRQPRCCGALQSHAGVSSEAHDLARATIAAYEDFDAIIANVAGCGSAMKDYGELLADDPDWAERAQEFSSKVKDVHELLAEHEPQAPRHPLPVKLAYHDACHLAHGQGIRQAPRQLLLAIPGVELHEPPEWEICCGSAGIYNLTQPDIANELGRRKAENLVGTGAEIIAAANPGCAMQIAASLDGDSMPIHHPITLIDKSIRGEPL